MRLDRALAHLERYPFHMPGHKRNPDFGLPGAEIDITEIDGYDDLHAPPGCWPGCKRIWHRCMVRGIFSLC